MHTPFNRRQFLIKNSTLAAGVFLSELGSSGFFGWAGWAAARRLIWADARSAPAGIVDVGGGAIRSQNNCPIRSPVYVRHGISDVTLQA